MQIKRMRATSEKDKSAMVSTENRQSAVTTTEIEIIHEALEKARAKLLDKTRRNRLLNFKESSRDVAIIDEIPNQVFSHLVKEQKPFYFLEQEEEPELEGDNSNQLDGALNSRGLPLSAPDIQGIEPRYIDNKLQTPYPEKDLQRKLRGLYRQHRTLIEETGANDLYLAIGFLKWKDSPDSEISNLAPLVMIPVRLEREKKVGDIQYRLHFDDEALDTNYSLLEKLQADFSIILPELHYEQGPEEYLTEVGNCLEKFENEGWQIVREMVLGIFRFSKQVMYHDLDPERWPDHSRIDEKPVLARVLLGAGKDEQPPGPLTGTPPDIDETVDSNLKLILNADSSQFAAIHDAFHAETGIVVEGPPGTGKSQSIANLIAAALDEGQTVLFVAEKMAALEVVYKRLDQAGLGDFCLQLHGLRTNKKEMLEDVDKRINRRWKPQSTIESIKKALLQKRAELIELSKVLGKKVGPENAPLYKLIWKIEATSQELPDNYNYPSVDSEYHDSRRFSEGKRLLRDLGREWSAIPEDARKAWKGWLPEKFESSNRETISSKLKESQKAIIKFKQAIKDFGLDQAPIWLQEPQKVRSLAQSDPSVDLPKFPSGGCLEVVHNALKSNALDVFEALCLKALDFLSMVSSINETFDYSNPSSEKYCSLLKTCDQDLTGTVCDDSTKIGGLPVESQRYDEAISHLESLKPNSFSITRYKNRICRTLDDFLNVERDAEELAEGPSELTLYAYPEHTRPKASAIYSQAKSLSEKLTAKMEGLPQFNHSHKPDMDELSSAILSFKRMSHSWFSWLKREYRSARRVIKQNLVNHKIQKTADFQDSLDRFLKLSEEKLAFKCNGLFQKSLGQTFNGVDTDWDALVEMIEHAEKLVQNIGLENTRKILADWNGHLDEMQIAKDHLHRSRSALDNFKSDHPLPAALWKRPVEEIGARLRELQNRVKTNVEAVVTSRWCNGTLQLSDIGSVIQNFKAAKKMESSIIHHKYFSKLIEPMWDGADSNENTIESTRSWLKERLQRPFLDRDLLLWLLPDTEKVRHESFSNLVSAAGLFDRQQATFFDFLCSLGEVKETMWYATGQSGFDHLLEKFSACESHLDHIELMIRWRLLDKKVRKAGLELFADQVSEELLVGDMAAKAFSASVRKQVAKTEIESHDLLKTFTHTKMESLRQEFSKLDSDLLQLNADSIANRLLQVPVPKGNSRGRVGDLTEKALLRHEIGKKRRHTPIRQLVKRAGNALQALKPCFLMSPISVAQYLPPGEIEFHLMVMDEASQIRPEDALGALARTRRAVIVGDEKQLPPTSFFDALSADDDDNTIIDDTDSIIKVCRQQFPFRRLRWHYRSRHESLIQFSNDQFYEGDLIVLPSRRPQVRDLGVHYNRIENPNYKRGRNRAEAEVVVANIIRHYQEFPKRSLGVAAFNKRQAEDIHLILEKKQNEYPELCDLFTNGRNDEPLFIKNLENVQGDERDVIFISTTYGPEKADAPVYQRFGPINSELGWRRLNVITTRAKERVEVFTSLKPTDIRIGPGSSRGVQSLRDYLEYALTGKYKDHGSSTGPGPDSEFEIAVGNILQDLGYQVQFQVGVAGFFIDLGVVHPDRPGEYLAGIECDGAPYHSSQFIRDRDRLRQEIIEDKGWRIHRIWSTSWYHARAAEINRLKEALETFLAEDRTQSAQMDQAPSSPSIVQDTPPKTDSADLEMSDSELLQSALDRFWEKNIKPEFPDRSCSILSPKLVGLLAEQMPLELSEWREKIPLSLREKINLKEMDFMEDVFAIIEDYY